MKAPRTVARHGPAGSPGSGIRPIRPYPVPVADRPGPAAAWRPDPARAALLLHDLQRYFVAPYALDASPGRELLAGARALLDGFRAAGAPVFYSAQPGDMDPAQRGLLADFWGPGMSAREQDRGIVPELAPRPGEQVLTKWRYSAFERTGLAAALRAAGRDQLVVCGVFGHVGVLGTALDAFAADVQPFVAGDAIADFSPEAHESTLEYAAARCARVLSVRTLLAELRTAERCPAG